MIQTHNDRLRSSSTTLFFERCYRCCVAAWRTGSVLPSLCLIAQQTQHPATHGEQMGTDSISSDALLLLLETVNKQASQIK